MPTAAAMTYGGSKFESFYPGAETIAVEFGASLTIAKGTVVAMKTADKKFYAYNNANIDGTEVARGICVYDIKTSAAGLVTLGDATPGEIGADELSAPIYTGGYFNVADMTGLDAPAVVDLGRLVEGIISAGVLKVT